VVWEVNSTYQGPVHRNGDAQAEVLVSWWKCVHSVECGIGGGESALVGRSLILTMKGPYATIGRMDLTLSRMGCC
jgi:hypothetical protein